MFHWLQSGHKRYRYWLQLAVCSCILHLVLLLCILNGTNSKKVFRFSVHHAAIRTAPVVFIPFEEPEPAAAMSADDVSDISASQAGAQPALSAAVSPNKQQEKKKIVPAKKEAAPTKKQVKEKPKPKKPVAETTHKKSAPVKKTEVHSKPAQKQAVGKSLPTTVKNSNALDTSHAVPYTQDQRELIMVQNYVYEKVGEQWQPPKGLSADLTCEVMVTIDMKGEVNEVMLHKSSGVLLYDVSVRTALLALNQVPRAAWGNTLHLTFKQ
jgi:outer membrane biosynthesis protein TonB